MIMMMIIYIMIIYIIEFASRCRRTLVGLRRWLHGVGWQVFGMFPKGFRGVCGDHAKIKRQSLQEGFPSEPRRVGVDFSRLEVSPGASACAFRLPRAALRKLRALPGRLWETPGARRGYSKTLLDASSGQSRPRRSPERPRETIRDDFGAILG